MPLNRIPSARPAKPAPWRVLSLDTEISAVLWIAVVCAALQAWIYVATVPMVESVEWWLQVQPLQLDIAEHAALAGTAHGSEVVSIRTQDAGARRRIASARELEEAQVRVLQAELAGSGFEAAGRRSSGSGRVSGSLNDDTVVLAVTSAHAAKPLLVEFRAELDARSPGMLNWKCGAQLALQPPAARQPAVAPTWLPMTCREGS